MTTHNRSILLIAILGVAGASALADRDSAETLAGRLNSSISGMEIHPVWAPDDSAFYIHDDSRITRIDTDTGQKTTLYTFKKQPPGQDGKPVRIERITACDNGDVACLWSAPDTIVPFRIEGNRAIHLKPEEDPFALTPMRSDGHIQSDRTGGDTQIIFINNTAEPVDIYWVESAGLPQLYVTVPPDQCYWQHTYAGDAWIAGNLAFVATEEPSTAYLGAAPQEPDKPRNTTSDHRWRFAFRDHNLVARDERTGEETPLTTDGTSDWFYRGPGCLSPDDRYVVVFRQKAGETRRIDLIEAAPGDRLQPRTKSIDYPKPGDRINQIKPYLFDLQTMKNIPVDDALLPNPWDLHDFHWSLDSDRFYFVYNERGHQTARLLAADAKTGRVAVVAEETSSTFIDWTNKLKVHHLDQTDEAIWMSERSGWNHLYLVDRKTGKTSPITTGEWVVRNIEKVDEESREILFRAGGVVPGMDPYYIHFGRVGFDGSNLTWLTEGNGSHSISLSPMNRYYIDTWSRVDEPPVHELRRYADGKRLAILEEADASALLEIHPHLPEPFVAKGRDGQTDIYGVIFRPSDFDPKQKYPVIEDIYAGPQDFFVPKVFKPYHKQQRLAELGFIVVQIDGMGTNWRSKKFHDVCFKNLKDAGFPDRIAWLKAAADKYPWMDLTRVGIYGTSAGGQSAMRAVIDHADFYKAAAADCGCHDNRMDKIWWNEQWMGWPVDESYVENSNMEDAHKLGGKLLLTVGAMDSNVDPSSTMQVVDELIKADKEFELMVFPSAGHGAGTREYGTRLRERFFIRHLL